MSVQEKLHLILLSGPLWFWWMLQLSGLFCRESNWQLREAQNLAYARAGQREANWNQEFTS